MITARNALPAFPAFAVIVNSVAYDNRDCEYTATHVVSRHLTITEARAAAKQAVEQAVDDPRVSFEAKLMEPLGYEVKALDALDARRDEDEEEGERMRCMSPHEIVAYVGRP